MENIISNSSILSSLSPRAIKIYNFLIEKANRKTRSSFWRRSKIALACSMSESTFARGVRELKAARLIAIQERYETCGRQKSNEYFLLKDSQAPFMSTMALTGALSGSNLKVYLYISGRCGDTAYRIAMKDIAGACGIALKTAQKCVATLKRYSYINVQAQNRLAFYGDKGCGYNLYSVCQSPGHIANRQNLLKRILCALLASIMTPSPTSSVTPPLTYSKLKITNKKKIGDVSLEPSGNQTAQNDSTNSIPAKSQEISPPHHRLKQAFFEVIHKIPAFFVRSLHPRRK